MRYSNYIGILAAIVLIVACFLPWAYYPDIDKTFTGFFSEQNRYGKPGKALVFFAIIAIALFIIPKVWAKRLNMVVTAMALAFSVRCYMLFSACYRGTCPEKNIAIYLIMIASLVMIIASVLPDLKLKDRDRS
jgi:amino acid permease